MVFDRTVAEIADSLSPKHYSPRESIRAICEYLDKNKRGEGYVVLKAYKMQYRSLRLMKGTGGVVWLNS